MKKKRPKTLVTRKKRHDELAKPIHGIASDKIDRRRNSEHLTKVFKKAAGLGKEHPPVGSTFTIPAKAKGRFHRQLRYDENTCKDLRARELQLDGRALPRNRSRAPELVTLISGPPHLIG